MSFLTFFLVLVAVGVTAGLLTAGYMEVQENKKKRRMKLDEEPVDFDDWRFGSPHQPVPERAKAIDPWEATDRQRR